MNPTEAGGSNLYGLAPRGFQERVSLALTHIDSHPLGHFTDFTPTDSRLLVSTRSEQDPRFNPRSTSGHGNSRRLQLPLRSRSADERANNCATHEKS